MSTSKRQREEPCYICGHYHDYERGERCGICGHVMLQSEAEAEESSAMPTQILPGFLYLGSYDHASRLELLKALGITHVLSLVPSCQELYKNTLTYHTVRCSPAELQECFDYIDSVRAEQKRILVHCMTGIAKSPAIVIAYLMKLRGWTLKESFLWVKDRHPNTELSTGNKDWLQNFEVQLHGSSSPGFQWQGQTGAPSNIRGPFGRAWLPHCQKPGIQTTEASEATAVPSLAFSQSSDLKQNFIFGSAASLQASDVGQAAMDV